VLNGFNIGESHTKLMATVFQNMFPSLKVHKVCIFLIILYFLKFIYRVVH